MRLGSMMMAAALVVAGSAAQAQELGATTAVPMLSLFGGKFDVRDNAERDKATDLRLEYRFGDSLFYVIKPLVGVEATTDGGAGVFGGVVADWVIADHWVVAPSVVAGLWAHGGGKEMGSPIEFRSQLEAGYRFDNDWRVTAAYSHMSNGGIGNKNPGAEVAGIYLHMPVDSVLPR